MEKDRLKILLVISTTGWGGTEAYVSLLAKGLIEQGASVWIAAPGRSKVSEFAGRSLVLPIFSSPVAFLWNLVRIIVALLYHRIQVIHGNSGKDYWLVLIAGMVTFRKTVLTRHLMTPVSPHTRSLIVLNRTAVIAPANVTFDVLSRSGIPAEALRRIYNGIDPAPFLGTHAGKFRLLYRIPANAFVTGIVSNIHHPRGKGHFTLIASAPEILKRIPNAYWLIGGDGPLVPDLVRLVKKAGLTDRIRFAGALYPRQVPQFLSCLDLFVLLSYDQEGGCPLSIMEAMASGLPVIASRVGGNSEIVEDSRTGYLIGPEETNRLIEETFDLCHHPDKRKKMGEEGRQRILGFFNYGRMAEETKLFYREQLSNQG